MIKATLATRIRRILETDRTWSAYALADLEPEEAERCEWLVGEMAVILVYRGLVPSVLFAHGDPYESIDLLDQLPPGQYQYTFQEPTRAALGDRLRPAHEVRMWRMGLNPAEFDPPLLEGVVQLAIDDMPRLLELFDGHADRPDAFHERQLENGAFYGVTEQDCLVSVAGTHIVAPRARIAAIGNVFTRPDRRGRGLARRTSAAVIGALLKRGISTIVLNVSQENIPAVRCYRRLGFKEHCPYLEGWGQLTPASDPENWSVP